MISHWDFFRTIFSKCVGVVNTENKAGNIGSLDRRFLQEDAIDCPEVAICYHGRVRKRRSGTGGLVEFEGSHGGKRSKEYSLACDWWGYLKDFDEKR